MATIRTQKSINELYAKTYGSPVLLGTIDATTTGKTNGSCSVPFNVAYPALLGKALLIQPDAECYITVAYGSAVVITTADSIKFARDERVIILMDEVSRAQIENPGSWNGYIAAVTSSGTANVKVWELQ